MIKANTIISVHDDRLTLLQWLKAVEKEAEGAKVEKVELIATADGNTVKITLADGTEIESPRVKTVGALDEFIQHVAEGNVTQIVTNAEIAGNLKLKAGLADFDGKTGLQGEVLTSNGGSVEWKKPTGGSKLYLHTFTDEHNEARFYIISRSAEPMGVYPSPICSNLYSYPQDFIDGGFIFQGECKKILSAANIGLGVFVIDGYSDNPAIEYIADTSFPQIANETITDY